MGAQATWCFVWCRHWRRDRDASVRAGFAGLPSVWRRKQCRYGVFDRLHPGSYASRLSARGHDGGWRRSREVGTTHDARRSAERTSRPCEGHREAFTAGQLACMKTGPWIRCGGLPAPFSRRVFLVCRCGRGGHLLVGVLFCGFPFRLLDRRFCPGT